MSFYNIISSSVRMQKYQEEYTNYKMLMGDQKQLTKIESLVVLVHSINRANKLVCLHENQECQFPVNWRDEADNAYAFTYRNDRNHSILMLRAAQKDKKVEIMFNEVDSALSYRVLLDLEQSTQQSSQKYDLNLQEYLKSSQKKENAFSIKRGSQVPQPPVASEEGHSPAVLSQNVGGYPPRNLINSPTFINNPFGQEEYVGPNSQIFANPYENQKPFPGSLKIPPGARYDAVDPFDNPYENNKQGPQEFFGFDELGRPKKSPFSGNNKGGMNNFGGRSGFGGGFGGFGGGGFGGNFGI